MGAYLTEEAGRGGGFLEGVRDPSTLVGSMNGSTNLPHNAHSNVYANALVVKTGPAILYGFQVYNSNASAQFIQVFDAAALPADGTVPVTFFTVAGVANLPVNWFPGRSFLVGIVLCNSSTGPTKTIGAADCFFDVQYI
jgi:hypothetical protein